MPCRAKPSDHARLRQAGQILLHRAGGKHGKCSHCPGQKGHGEAGTQPPADGGRLRNSRSAASCARRARSCLAGGRTQQRRCWAGGQIWLDRASEPCSGDLRLVVAGGQRGVMAPEVVSVHSPLLK